MEGLTKTKENGPYNDTVRAIYQDLVMMGVGINNIEKVVRTVLTNFTNMDIFKTYGHMDIYTELRKLSQFQVAESLLKDYDSSYRTLHTDGTSQFGKHYGTYDVVTEQGETLTAGIREVLSDDIETQLIFLLDILPEIEKSLQNTEKNVSNKTISSIKNIMSHCSKKS